MIKANGTAGYPANHELTGMKGEFFTIGFYSLSVFCRVTPSAERMRFSMLGSLNIHWYDLIIRIFSAVVVGGIIGIEREYKNRPAGMRTHVLVCFGAMLIALLECLIRQNIAETQLQNASLSIGRLAAQVISGIGFLGAGTILSTQKKITGLTTAASLWNVACLGLMIGYGYYLLAIGCSIIILVVLLLLQRIIRVNAIKKVEVKFNNRSETLAIIANYFESHEIKVLDMDFHVENDAESPENRVYTNLYTLHLPTTTSYTDIVTYFSECKNIQSVRTRNT